MREIKRGLKALVLTLLAYLFQVCVMLYFPVSGVVGNLPFAWLAILVVSYGKKYGFCASCIIGMLMEAMLSNVHVMYLVAYPIITMLCAQVFADMSDRQRERRRTQNTDGRRRENDLPVIVRIPCCAALMDFILEVVLCAYMYLIGVEITWLHVGRVLLAVLYTTALALLLMYPVRVLLGMYPRRKKARAQGGEM